MRKLLLSFVVLLGAQPAFAQSKLNVIATTEDLASIEREVGGDRINSEALARGYQDPHFVEAKPSFILKLQKADVLIAVGRELEIGWLPPLVQQSRNSRIQPGADGCLLYFHHIVPVDSSILKIEGKGKHARHIKIEALDRPMIEEIRRLLLLARSRAV